MTGIKKYLGILWIILSIALVFFMFYQAWDKIQLAPIGVARTNTTLQWIIILIVFIPVCAGLFIFGKYAWNNEYSLD